MMPLDGKRWNSWREQGDGGAIVNIGSTSGFRGRDSAVAYAAAKGGINGLTREWAVDLAADSIRVNTVLPAETWTPLYDRILNETDNPEQAKQQIERLIPFQQRFTTTQEIADMVVFLASPRSGHTTGQIISKSISQSGGRSSYRGLVRVEKGAHETRCNVVCDALILDQESRSDTYPYIEINEQDVSVGHEASVSRIGEEQLFYLTSRGLTEAEASTMIVNGFIEPLVKELPMEYAVEMNRLIQLQMEGSVG
mgnify:CR=1 FL=1